MYFSNQTVWILCVMFFFASNVAATAKDPEFSHHLFDSNQFFFSRFHGKFNIYSWFVYMRIFLIIIHHAEAFRIPLFPLNWPRLHQSWFSFSSTSALISQFHHENANAMVRLLNGSWFSIFSFALCFPLGLVVCAGNAERSIHIQIKIIARQIYMLN